MLLCFRHGQDRNGAVGQQAGRDALEEAGAAVHALAGNEGEQVGAVAGGGMLGCREAATVCPTPFRNPVCWMLVASSSTAGGRSVVYT